MITSLSTRTMTQSIMVVFSSNLSLQEETLFTKQDHFSIIIHSNTKIDKDIKECLKTVEEGSQMGLLFFWEQLL